MKKQDDLRIIKTKLLIKYAFFELAYEEGFEKITVSSIANKAMINRSTFYLHYDDKYDLFRSIENEILEDIEAITSKVTLEYLQSYRNSAEPFPHVVELLYYVRENPEFFNLTIQTNYDMSFYNKLGEKINKTLSKAIPPKIKSDEILQKYIINIIVSVISSVLNQWIKTGMKETANEIASVITKIAVIFLDRLIFDETT